MQCVMELTQPTKQVLELLKNGHNVLLTGAGGCGKSHTLVQLGAAISTLSKSAAFTAMTGAATQVYDGRLPCQTLHKWACIGLGKDPVDILIRHVRRMCKIRDRVDWCTTDVLVIDEVSMLSAELFEKLDSIARTMRRDDRPFGGIQLVVCGDFLQLPPVNGEFAFTSKVWEECLFCPVVLSTSHRQTDPVFTSLLMRARVGTISDADAAVLAARVGASVAGEEFGILPTVLYARRVDVALYNKKELDALRGDEFVFDHEVMRESPSTGDISSIVEAQVSAPSNICLKVGAQVMCCLNIGEHDLCNGSRGIVTDITDGGVVTVLLTTGYEVSVGRQKWGVKWTEYRNDVAFEHTATVSQIPFILAWAMTIHKAQGATLDSAVVDLGRSIFSDGQAYVALSRVRGLASLSLSSFARSSIRASKLALDYLAQI